MALQKFGDGSYRFGINSAEALAIRNAVGLAPQKISRQGEPEFTATAEDETGYVAALAVADDKQTFTMEGYIVDLAKFLATGGSFTLDGKFYVVTGRGQDSEPKLYEKGTLTGMFHSKITGPVI